MSAISTGKFQHLWSVLSFMSKHIYFVIIVVGMKICFFHPLESVGEVSDYQQLCYILRLIQVRML
jgi:hypothetical protein